MSVHSELCRRATEHQKRIYFFFEKTILKQCLFKVIITFNELSFEEYLRHITPKQNSMIWHHAHYPLTFTFNQKFCLTGNRSPHVGSHTTILALVLHGHFVDKKGIVSTLRIFDKLHSRVFLHELSVPVP